MRVCRSPSACCSSWCRILSEMTFASPLAAPPCWSHSCERAWWHAELQETDFPPCFLRCHMQRQSWRCTCPARSWSRCPRTRCNRHSFGSLAFLVKSHCPCLRHVTLILAQSTPNSIRPRFQPFSRQSKPGQSGTTLHVRAPPGHWPTRYPCELRPRCLTAAGRTPTHSSIPLVVSPYQIRSSRPPQMRQGNLSDRPMLSFPRG